MERKYDIKLVFEDQKEYYGYSFGVKVNKVCEIVFNTSMVGYQEIISDPSYTDQAVVMTYPLIGNYGITEEDFEAKNLNIGALIVSEYNDIPSNFRSIKTLSETLIENNIAGIYGLDTRELTRSIRDFGSRKVLITKSTTPLNECLKILKETEIKNDQVKRVSTKKRYFSKTQDYKYNVLAIDCGMKLNIVRELNKRYCNVVIVPYEIDYKTVIDMKVDGIFISNGPGNPEDVTTVINLVKKLKGTIPIFGICLGHQIISLAYGAKTYKLKFGHRGGNHPVKNLLNNKIEITSQNHSYAVDAFSLKNTDLEITHINLLDNTVEGIRSEKDYIFSVQYHPESAPGPQDSRYLFDNFVNLMKEFKENA